MLAVPAGCGGGDREAPAPSRDPTAVPVPIGPAPRWRPPALWSRAAAGRSIEPAGGRTPLRCTPAPGRRFGVHVELFAARRVVLVPAGIGVARPRRVEGAYVRGGRCSYAVQTREPTGVLEVKPGRALTLGDLFEVWGQPLSRVRLGSFRGPVEAYVGGRRFGEDPRRIPLRRHAQIVLAVAGHVPPHRRFRFRPGL